MPRRKVQPNPQPMSDDAHRARHRIVALHARGMTLDSVAAAIGTRAEKVRGWLERESEPSEAFCYRLEQLHALKRTRPAADSPKPSPRRRASTSRERIQTLIAARNSKGKS